MSEALDRVRRAMDGAGLSRVREGLLAGAREGVRYVLTAGEGGVGATRFGGSPDVPRGFEWPVHRGVDARFVAQLDLAELASLLPASPLPKDGLLSFFWWQEDPVGYDPDGCRVFLFDRAGLERCVDPWSLKPEGLGWLRKLLGRKPSALGRGWRGCSARAERGWWLSELAMEAAAGGVELNDEEGDAIHGGHWRELEAAGLFMEGHHALGCARPVQNAVEVDAELGDVRGAGGAAAWRTAAGRAHDWRCLLEVVSDEGTAGPAPGFVFGDAGTLYFMLREADLAAGRFERTRIVTQCG